MVKPDKGETLETHEYHTGDQTHGVKAAILRWIYDGFSWKLSGYRMRGKLLVD